MSLVPKHQPIVPSTLLAPATNIRTDKATKIQTLSFKIAQQKTVNSLVTINDVKSFRLHYDLLDML